MIDNSEPSLCAQCQQSYSDINLIKCDAALLHRIYAIRLWNGWFLAAYPKFDSSVSRKTRNSTFPLMGQHRNGAIAF